MKHLNMKNWKVAGIAIFGSMSLVLGSCKKEITETNATNSISTNTNYTAAIISNQLTKFWANYSAFKQVPIDDGTSADLDGLLNDAEMLSTLHYSLNTALTEVDTTYEVVTTAEFLNDLTLTGENTFTNENVCVFFDKTLQTIKTYTSSTELVERKIHEINLDIVSYNSNTVTIKTTVKFSGGELYATSDLDWTGSQSPYLAKFDQNTNIPWVAKSTAEQGKQASGHGKYNYFRFLLDSNWNVTPSAIGTIQSKLSNDKAAHDYLSSNALCWVNPALPKLAPATALSKIVPSDDKINGTQTMVPLINQELTMGIPSENITPLDVAVTCGNPSPTMFDQFSGGANDIQPSALLSYYSNEKDYNLTEFRNVNGPQMNFFWKNRDKIIKVAFNKKATEINDKLNNFNFGFYAVSELKYVAQAWPSRGEINTCYDIICTPNLHWYICHYQEDYRPDIVFKHYSYQPLPPAQWRNLQKIVF
jgi:hypothetical protein